MCRQRQLFFRNAMNYNCRYSGHLLSERSRNPLQHRERVSVVIRKGAKTQRGEGMLIWSFGSESLRIFAPLRLCVFALNSLACGFSAFRSFRPAAALAKEDEFFCGHPPCPTKATSHPSVVATPLATFLSRRKRVNP